MIKAIIFDLDGTLLYSLEDLANACNYALNTLEFNTHEVEAYKHFVGNGREKLIERILPEDSRGEETIKKALELFDYYYGKHMLDMTKPYEGIVDLIEELKLRHIKLAVVSNKPHEFAVDVVKKYFNDDFEVVYGQRPNYATKPDPATVYEVMEELQVNKMECIYVGDSNVDIKTAINADVQSVGVIWGFRGQGELEEAGADYLINKPSELLGIINEV